jgi:hypothetical protein
MKRLLTEASAYAKLEEFFLNNPTPFVLYGTGTSCAVDVGYGMNALKTHLLSKIPEADISQLQRQEWNKVESALRRGSDLEMAMNYVQDDSLERIIVQSTAELLISLDKTYALKIMDGSCLWPAISLFQKLVDGLQGGDRTLHVATPNYDMLAEYAFEASNIPYVTGFVGGICRRLDWISAGQVVTCVEKTVQGKKVSNTQKPIKHLRLYKVHGSLNTFILKDTIVENNLWVYNPPDSVERSMITPGTTKYKKLHKHRPELLGQYDKAIEKHNAFLFVGFGFNDNQLITGAIKNKLKEQKCQALIITRDCNERIKGLMNDCENVWLVCKHPDKNNQGTGIFNKRYDRPYCNDRKLWDPMEFTKKILGG